MLKFLEPFLYLSNNFSIASITVLAPGAFALLIKYLGLDIIDEMLDAGVKKIRRSEEQEEEKEKD